MNGSNKSSSLTWSAAVLAGAGALIVWMGRREWTRRTNKKKNGNEDQGVSLPYFDDLFKDMGDQPHLEIAFGRHVHWGYWKEPPTYSTAATNAERAQNFADAAEALCQLVCDTTGGPIKAGEHLLDVGCGFGGTIASLNERYFNLTMTGLNIDERQLERARNMVHATNENKLSFVRGNACELLGMPDGSFDMVSAVECIFHFPSREQFFAEAHRVLKPGGRLVLSDFVLAGWLDRITWLLIGNFLTDKLYGDIRVTCSRGYHDLAKNAGFRVVSEVDVTKETLPTYPFLKRILKTGHRDDAGATVILEWLSQRGWLRYMVYRFDRE